MRILVVDDEASICELLDDYLSFEGFDVTTALTAEDALAAFESGQFDAVLTDMRLPGENGLQLLKRLTTLGRDTCLIMMTGFGTVETAIEAMKHGAYDYILKPFKPEEVLRVLRSGLERQRLQRENLTLRQTVGFYEVSEAVTSTMALSQQLQLIVDTVHDSMEVQGALLVAPDPDEPGTYGELAAAGMYRFGAKHEALIATLMQEPRILAQGPQLYQWLQAPVTTGQAVSYFMAAPLRARGAVFGYLAVFALQGQAPFTLGQQKGLAVFASKAASAIETARAYGDLEKTFTETITGFARALEAKDTYTRGHSDRVALYSRLIAETLGMSPGDVRRIEHGGLMHDIGKIGIRSANLNKPQRLTTQEYAVFKTHPVVGKRIIEPIGFLAQLVPCVYAHHESYNGKGYPEGLGGNDIPFDARVLAVADAYDAMTSNRPYRKAMPHMVALAELKRCAGRQFDPHVVKAFAHGIDGWRAARCSQGLAVPA